MVLGASIKRLVAEPVFQFLVAGSVVYGLYLAAEPEVAQTADTRVVELSAGEVAWMEDTFQSRWMRPPTPEEKQGLIDQYVRETVLYREALAMGLDQNDTVIRRRLAQKLEFLSADLAQPEPPDDETLQAFFEDNIVRYTPPRLITFTQIFFDPDKRGDRTLADAEAVKVKLEADDLPVGDNRGLGDSIGLQNYYPDRTKAEIAKMFGSGFAGPVVELAPGEWHGPILSGYGTHLVYIHNVEESPAPALDLIRDQVQEDWLLQERERRNAELIAALIERYTIVIEPPAESADAVNSGS